jgi:hypothetical protein
MSKKRPVLDLKKPSLFKPKFRRKSIVPKVSKKKISLSSMSDTAIDTTASFRYDGPHVGIKSTQQVNVDYSRFENHTFFNSAQAKTNVAFDQIINNFPFDGSKREEEIFLDQLTGFEKYVYDEFPKSKGYLNFSGSNDTADPLEGSYIKVVDSAGGSFPNLSKKRTGERVVDPGSSSTISFEFHILIPSQSNDNQIIIQRASSTAHGITLGISSSTDTGVCDLIFSAVSSSNYMSASIGIEKGKFNYIYACLDRYQAKNKLVINLNNKQTVTSSDVATLRDFGFSNDPLLIGSGTHIDMDGFVKSSPFKPRQTFSGSIDELRIFHSDRSQDLREKFEKRQIYAQDDLKLYFKFNEPTGSIGVGDGSIILDSSGNSLHSLITNFDYSLRSTGSVPTPMTLEEITLCPVLFPAFKSVRELNSRLLSSGSDYDVSNPNLITRLIPPHYFLEGGQFEGLSSEDGTIMRDIGGASIPGSHQLGTAQLLTSFLFVWAKFFDEMKIFNDSFSKLMTIDYDTDETISDQFLQFYAKYFGFNLPNFFRDATPDQYVHGRDNQPEYSTGIPLAHIQNQIWRRILVNLQDIISSKGTVHSIKSLIRSVGINPDNNFRIREYGGPTKRSLRDMRERKTETTAILDFSGSLRRGNSSSRTVNAQGKSLTIPFLQTGFLSSSRVEVGYPEPKGQFKYANFTNPTSFGMHGVTDNVSDGLQTSGSFTYEGTYVFLPSMQKYFSVTQSLARLVTTGTSTSYSSGHGIVSNLLVVSASTISSMSVKFITSPSTKPDSPILELVLTGTNLFDGNPWNVSFGRNRSDDLGFDSYLTSSYFLRCARQSFGEIKEYYITSSMFIEDSDVSNNVLQNITADYNPSGTFITIGSQSINTSDILLNSTGSSVIGRETEFGGQISQIRFWSKGLNFIEWKDHVLNFKSVGVADPRTNFNFHTHRTGAFNRLRVDLSTDQEITSSDASGNISIIDFSQNNISGTAAGFESSKRVIKPKTFYYSHLSPKFDILQTDNKVRHRSLMITDDKIDDSYVVEAPLYNIVKSEEPQDDARFSIDISSTMALDEDIMNIFSTLDFFDDAMGQANRLFIEDYPEIVQARKVYFNRLDKKINLKHFFEFFKWFDDAMGEIISDLIPKKTNYFGINFVIESHVLERNKFMYHFLELYERQGRPDKPRRRDRDQPEKQPEIGIGRLKKY